MHSIVRTSPDSPPLFRGRRATAHARAVRPVWPVRPVFSENATPKMPVRPPHPYNIQQQYIGLASLIAVKDWFMCQNGSGLRRVTARFFTSDTLQLE